MSPPQAGLWNRMFILLKIALADSVRRGIHRMALMSSAAQGDTEMSPRPPFWFRIGTFTPVLALLLTGSAVAIASLASFGVFAARGHMLEAPTSTELDATLVRVGISAEALAAAGCSDVDATNVGGDARVFLDAARWASLQSADQDVRDAQSDVERLARLVRGGQAGQEDLSAYSTAQATLASAQSTRDATLDSVLGAAVADLEPAELTLLEAMHANAARPVALQYRVATRTDQQWTSLRDALANLKTSDTCGEEPDSGCEQLVASTDAEPAVATAKGHLDENLAEVSTAYAAALGYE